MAKSTLLSGVAKPPKFIRWQSPQACTAIPLLGVPLSDRPQFSGWSSDASRLLDDDRADQEQSIAFCEKLFAQYLETVPDFVSLLIEGYELVDIALKVVGVGSVGTRCYVALLMSGENRPLLLQVKDDRGRNQKILVSGSKDGTLYAVRESDGKLFWLTPRVLRLGQSYLESARLPRLVQPFIQRLSMATGETVNMSVLDGHEVVYVARSNPPRFVSVGYHVGVRVPAHGVTPGVVILATWPDEALDAWIAAHDFARYTAHTVTAPTQFRSTVQAARGLGYWITEQQLEMGLVGIGLALLIAAVLIDNAIPTTAQRGGGIHNDGHES